MIDLREIIKRVLEVAKPFDVTIENALQLVELELLGEIGEKLNNIFEAIDSLKGVIMDQEEKRPGAGIASPPDLGMLEALKRRVSNLEALVQTLTGDLTDAKKSIQAIVKGKLES